MRLLLVLIASGFLLTACAQPKVGWVEVPDTVFDLNFHEKSAEISPDTRQFIIQRPVGAAKALMADIVVISSAPNADEQLADARFEAVRRLLIENGIAPQKILRGADNEPLHGIVRIELYLRPSSGMQVMRLDEVERYKAAHPNSSSK